MDFDNFGNVYFIEGYIYLPVELDLLNKMVL